MKRFLVYSASVGLAACVLASCQQEQDAVEPEIVRPVLSTVVKIQPVQIRGFAGKVEPRYETQLGFRTLGRIVRRDVSVGDQVANGQELAAIDPLALELAVQAVRGEPVVSEGTTRQCGHNGRTPTGASQPEFGDRGDVRSGTAGPRSCTSLLLSRPKQT